MKLRDIFEKLDDLAPFEDAAQWDNSGLLVGREESEIKKVMLALDARGDVIEAAVREGAQLIVTHHPLIFGSLKKVNAEDFVGRRILTLAENRIACIAMHTNFDRHVMNIEAARMLGLERMETFAEAAQTERGELGFGYVGELPGSLTLEECAERVKEVFKLEKVDFFGDRQERISRAAIVSGSGAEFVDEARQKGAQLLVTGDVKYHNGIDAVEKGICVINAGHYGVEKLFVPYMKKFFERSLPEVEAVEHAEETPFGAL